jgi:two-component system nitrate/nitrite response regulator NarL
MTQAATSPLRLLIIDDHQLVSAALRMLIEDAGLSVVGMARNRTEALELTAREKPDLVLLDLDLAGEDGLSLLPELKDAAGNSRVLVLTGIRDPEAHRRAVKLGAMGVVLKDQATDVLIKAIRKVCEGEVWLDRATMGNLLTEMTRKSSEVGPDDARIKSLTDREQQVITLIAEGLKNKQIAERLFISETTVTHHLSSIFSKLDVSDRLELVIYAFAHQLARLPK